ncbi:MAG TPA: DUF488 domain-containing protein [Stellaceae bacterium]|nr:DUF488 domain-containing protein [Stellaceae bacterium]
MIYTIGHSTRSAEELVALLREAAVDLLVDVRTVPRSRFNPQFNADALPLTLAPAGIGYRHIAALGGLRHRPKEAPPSPNGLWRNEAFQAYADYAMTPAFHAALEELRRLAHRHSCAVMCAEAVWWRCHRRIVADYLLAAGEEVRHIMGPGHIDPASLTSGAEPQRDGTIVYPPAQALLI